MNKLASEGVSLTKQAQAVAGDLMRPNPVIYWIDLLVSSVLAWGGLAVAATTASLPIGLVAGTISILALYRALVFIHELTHMRDDEVPGFRIAWNVLVGVPLMTPSLMYEGVHNVHHVKDRYGTALDPEYMPLSRFTPLSLAGFLFVALLAPLGALIRSAILTPLSFLIPSLRRYVKTRLSAMIINPAFVREDMNKPRTAWLVQDVACWLWSWTMLGALMAGLLPVRVFVIGFVIFALATFVNQARTLAAHLWDNEGDKMTLDEQFLDSVNVPPPNLASELWAPVGLRYHALHHLLPRLPYHNLGKAHARLGEALGPDSVYHHASQKGLFEALAGLFRRAGRKPQPVL